MKGIVLLAMLLMVPSVAYYQKQTFAGELQGRLEAGVRKLLQDEGVENPVARMTWMDVRISGQVATLEERDRLAAEVDALPGVRLTAGNNGLRARGWIELSREQDRWQARGLMPQGFQLGLVQGLAGDEALDDGLERSGLVEAPPQLGAWERFLGDYFAEPGDRSLRLRDGRLVLSGEATVGLRSDWLAGASRVVSKERVEDRLRVLPSVYHFAGYIPGSSRSAAEVKRLREETGALAVRFADGTAEVDVDERRKVAEAARIMLQAGERVGFVVAALVPGDGEEAVELGRRRVAAVVTLLGEYGVEESRLSREVFVATGAGGAPGRVEFLLN